MPDAKPLILPEPSLQHLFLQAAERIDYKGTGRGSDLIRTVERQQHAAQLGIQLGAVKSASNKVRKEIEEKLLPEMEGIVLKLETAPGYPLSPAKVDAITTKSRGTKAPQPKLLHAVRHKTDDGKEYTRLALLVPFGGLVHLEQKLKAFAAGSGTKDQAYFGNLSVIALAALRELWTDSPASCPTGGELRWWQLWIRKFPSKVWERFLHLKDNLGIVIEDAGLDLPEHKVVVVQASYDVLASSLPLLDCLSEIRGAYPYSIDFLALSPKEQREYVDDAVARIHLPGVNAPAVCLLDSGVNRAHPLLRDLLAPGDLDTVFADGDGSDIRPIHGHGTPMAGLAAYGDLRVVFQQSGPWEQHHRLESVRLVDSRNPHNPKNFGSVTLQAIRRPEITAPKRKRVYSLAVTAADCDGKPSAWGAAIDLAAYGDEGSNIKRLIIVSTGNVDLAKLGQDYRYPESNRSTQVQDPGQAWNALTVGAITHRVTLQEPDLSVDEATAIAPSGGLSPFSRTSCTWNTHWPVKPEIVLEGGNVALVGLPDCRESLELISTSASGVLGKDLCAFGATSAATAQAARYAVQIMVRYPEMWPETVRGLIVNSARWNPRMLASVDPFRPYTATNSRQNLLKMLRCYGFGEPHLGRSLSSAQHAVTMIREDLLTPYSEEKGIRLKDCHIHHLPWPTELLQENINATLVLRVTLSYFIAPNASANNALGSSRYRYAGCLLRFMVRHKEESEENFKLRLERLSSDDDQDNPNSEVEGVGTDTGWALGNKLRGKWGSLVHDVWKGKAVELATMDKIAVFPAKGWWAFKRNFPSGDRWHNCHKLPIRYSLIVSIEAEQDLPLYNAIQNKIQIPLAAS